MNLDGSSIVAGLIIGLPTFSIIAFIASMIIGARRQSPRTYPQPCTYCRGVVYFDALRGWRCKTCGRGLPGLFE